MSVIMTKYFIGTSGWNYDHWKGSFYPGDVPKTRWLEFYAGRFRTVEVNYSFYRWPSEKCMKGWKQRAPAGFEFTMKAPRTITHVKRLKDVGRLVSDFYRLTGMLGAKAGCHLFQLPPSMVRDDKGIARLGTFLKLLDERKRNVIEFRHGSWWDGDVYGMLKDAGAGFVTVAGLGMPGEAVVTGATAYFRFHGTERYGGDYPEAMLRQYSEAMEKARCGRVYAYFNNDMGGFAPKNAMEIGSMLATGGSAKR